MRALRLEGPSRRILLGPGPRAVWPAGWSGAEAATCISVTEAGVGERRERWRFSPKDSESAHGLRVVLLDAVPRGAIVTAWYGSRTQSVALGAEERDFWLAPADQPLEIVVRNGPDWRPVALTLPISKLLTLPCPRPSARPGSYPELLVRAPGRPSKGARPLLRPVLRLLEQAGVLSAISELPLKCCARVRMVETGDSDAALAILEGLGLSFSAAGTRYTLTRQTAPERAVVGFDTFHDLLLRADSQHRDWEDVPGFSAHAGMLVAIEQGAADPTRSSVFREDSVQTLPVEPGPYAERFNCDGRREYERYEAIVHATSIAGVLVGKSYDVAAEAANSLPWIEDPHLRYGGFGVNPTGGQIRVISTEAITAQMGECGSYSGEFELPTWEQALSYAERWSSGGPTQIGRIISASLTSNIYPISSYHGLYGVAAEEDWGMVPSLCGVTDEWAFAHDLVLLGAIQNRTNAKQAGVPSSCINAVGVGAFADSIYGLVGVQSDVPVNVHAIESGTLRIVSWFKPDILGPLEARVPRIRPGWEWGDGAGPRGSSSPYTNFQVKDYITYGNLSTDKSTVFGIGTSIATPIVASAAAWIWSLLGPSATDNLTRAVLFCTARGYPPVADVNRADDNPGDGRPRNPSVVRGFYRRSGGARDSVFGILSFDTIGKFFRRCELHDPEDWSSGNTDPRLDGFVAGYRLAQISTDEGTTFGGDVSPQELDIGSPLSLSEEFSDSTVQTWSFVGSMLLPRLRPSLQYHIVVTWKVPVDLSPLTAGQRRVINHHLRDHELTGSATLPEDFSPARVATPQLLVRLRVWSAGKGEAAVDQSYVSFISGAPYRAFRFSVPESPQTNSEPAEPVNLGLEFFWPAGVDVRHVPGDIAVALTGQRIGSAADPSGDPQGGLRIERDVVVEYEIQMDPQNNIPIEDHSDYVAFRPVWR